MTEAPQTTRLKKELSFFDVYALATGATLSAGLFLLPGLAAAQAGPAVVLCYLLAALPLVPAVFSIIELSTAMPRAGGAYYFLDRSLGPLAGTVGGIGTWLALTLKAAFALVGLGAYGLLLFPDAPDWLITLLATAFALLFGVINIYGSKGSGRFQVILLLGLISVLTWFMVQGMANVDWTRFQGFFDAGGQSILSTAGLVYISYVGVTNVASVSEEVKDPERNVPLAVILSILTSVTIYLVCTTVMVGVIPMDVLAGSLTPVASAADILIGKAGVAIVTFGALLAFSSVANAAILASSRYPLAMSRDSLLPPIFKKIARTQTPVVSIITTVAAIILFLLVLDPLRIAKLASAFQLFMFALLSAAVIVMRESRIPSYDPGFRSPFYPWMQIFGIAAPFVFIAEMGPMPILFSGALVAVGIAWYHFYARHRVERHGAIFHVFERLGHERFHGLDAELRGILKEKGLREKDPFDQVVAHAMVLDANEASDFPQLTWEASRLLAEQLPTTAQDLYRGFMEGTRTGATPVTKGVALPHLKLKIAHHPHLVLVRVTSGLRITTGDVFGQTTTSEPTFAIFFLVSPGEDAGAHLRMLAQLASRVDQDDFLGSWIEAEDQYRLKEIFLRHERYISLRVEAGTATGELVDRPVRDLELPVGCLVAAVRRGADTIVPRGGTVLEADDLVLVIGDKDAIASLYTRFDVEPLKSVQP